MTRPLAIEARGIYKTFGKMRAVEGASVVVEEGSVVALLGPSGSGKTTMLRVIAGFETPDEGTVAIGGRIVTSPDVNEEPERRRIGMVFQEGALFPHLSVARNVGFGDASPSRVEECLDLVGLSHRGSSYPHELSGGERQRVALARALAPEPAVVLLDEPFASLDAGLRIALREEVVKILRGAGASALLVTHDQQEALSLADVVTVMRSGRVEQTGSPQEMYARPNSRWLAEFLGDAEVLAGIATEGKVECDLGTFPADPALHGAVDVVVRPEAISIAREPTGGVLGSGVPARVVSRWFYGHDQIVSLALANGREIRSRGSGTESWAVDEPVRVLVCGSVTTVPAESTIPAESTLPAESTIPAESIIPAESMVGDAP
jgi:iron(III) transport system ATP-binding protein